MSTFFQDVINDVDKVEQELLGPDYNYVDQIKSPEEMGMSSKGTISNITKNISGLVGYTELLVTGNGNASKPGGPLGDKFFLETGAKCKDIKSGEDVTRSIYISNVPDGSIPFITQGMGGAKFTSFEGLVPGIMSNISNINPMQMFQAFMSGTTPECQAVTMPTIDNNNNRNLETKYLTNIDIKGLSPCLFPSKKNPITGKKCREGFNSKATTNGAEFPDDTLIQVYYSALGLLGLYILFKAYEKKR